MILGGCREQARIFLCTFNFWGCIPILDPPQPSGSFLCLCFSFVTFSLSLFFSHSHSLQKPNSGISSRQEGTGGLEALMGGMKAKLQEHLHRPSTPLNIGSWPQSQWTRGQRGESRWGPEGCRPHALQHPTKAAVYRERGFLREG